MLRPLYPERIGAPCVVVSRRGSGSCPIVVVFEDGFRGIAEDDWLVEDTSLVRP